MKKLWAIILTGVLIIALSGCARFGIGKRPDTVNPGNNTITPSPQQTLSAPTKPGEEQVAETVLVDQDGIRITATGLDVSTYGLEYPELQVQIENSNSKAVEIGTSHCAINGYMASGYLSDGIVPAKQTIDDVIEFYFVEGSTETGTDYVVSLDIELYAYDPDTYDTIAEFGLVHLETTAAQVESCTYDDSGANVVDNNDFKITLRDLIEEEDGSQYQEFYMYNKTGKTVIVFAEDVSVNGKALDPYFSTECMSGMHDMDWIYFFKSDLEGAGITDITEITVTFSVCDADTYEEIYNSGSLTITYN